MGLREETREAVRDIIVNGSRPSADRVADAASDKWEPLLREWLEIHDEPCRFDHHGYCQEHFLEAGCIVQRTREALQ